MRVAVLHLRSERPDEPVFNDVLETLNAATLATIADMGWSATVVASGSAPIETSLDAADAADAIIVMGGEDVSPEFYDGPVEYEGAGHHDIEADTAHIAVIQRAAATGTPLLGICRGVQLINVALGGTLVQHLETLGNHQAPGEGMVTFTSSHINLVGGSDLELDVPTSKVRCGHHQAVDRLGQGLVIAARADDGTVEALVHESAPITGVQWHPEHPDTAKAQLTALLKRLERQANQRGLALGDPALLDER